MKPETIAEIRRCLKTRKADVEWVVSMREKKTLSYDDTQARIDNADACRLLLLLDALKNEPDYPHDATLV
jgi:hypothetical protein